MKTLKFIFFLGYFLFINEFIFCFIPQKENFGPQAIRPLNMQEFGKPKYMLQIIPGKPIAARDKYGNRMYFTPDGGLILKISNDGSKEYSIGYKSKEVDSEGKLLKVIEKQRGNNLTVIKNHKDQIISYQELAFGGKVVKEYDKDKNLVKTTKYNIYGKSLQWILDELSCTKTVFNQKGAPIYDIDFEGNIIAKYQIENHSNKILYKEDVYGNRTYFDKKGNMKETRDENGNLLVKYYYKKDKEGFIHLEKAVDVLTKDVTFFKNGKPQYVLNYAGAVAKEYKWEHDQLVYTFDVENQQTTFYDLNGRPLYVMYNDYNIKEYLYYKGRLVGLYDEYTKSTLIFKYQREDLRVYTPYKPTAEEINKWYQEGLLDNIRIIDKN